MYLISWYKTNIKKSFWSLETVILCHTHASWRSAPKGNLEFEGLATILDIQASKNAAESIFWHFWNHFSIKIVIFASFSSKKKVFFC